MIPPQTRSGEARAAVDGRVNATRAGGAARGDHPGETPETQQPFQKIAREGKTFSLRAGRTQTTSEPQATEKWLQRAPQLRGNEKTHTQGFRAGGSAATREGFPSPRYPEHPRTEETQRLVLPQKPGLHGRPRQLSTTLRAGLRAKAKCAGWALTRRGRGRLSFRAKPMHFVFFYRPSSFSPRPPFHGLLRQ